MKKLFLSIFIILISIGVYAGDSARETLDKAIRSYSKGSYFASHNVFKSLYDQIPGEINPYASVELFLMIKSQYELNNYEKVYEYSREFLENFENSQYTDDILLHKAYAMFNEKYFEVAFITAVAPSFVAIFRRQLFMSVMNILFIPAALAESR